MFELASHANDVKNVLLCIRHMGLSRHPRVLQIMEEAPPKSVTKQYRKDLVEFLYHVDAWTLHQELQDFLDTVPLQPPPPPPAPLGPPPPTPPGPPPGGDDDGSGRFDGPPTPPGFPPDGDDDGSDRFDGPLGHAGSGGHPNPGPSAAPSDDGNNEAANAPERDEFVTLEILNTQSMHKRRGSERVRIR